MRAALGILAGSTTSSRRSSPEQRTETHGPELLGLRRIRRNLSRRQLGTIHPRLAGDTDDGVRPGAPGEPPRVPSADPHRALLLPGRTIEFRDVKTLWWTGQGTPPSYDPTGERDFGSIDSLVEADGSFAIEGDFGVIRLEASLPTVRLSTRDT